jgi:EmrB/QacA subfamily drug resistance transporter
VSLTSQLKSIHPSDNNPVTSESPSKQKSNAKSPKLILAVIAFGVFVAADDLTVVSTMLRQIVFDLGLSLPDDLDQAAWIVNAYLIAYVVVMPFIGRLSDILGRRLLYTAAMFLFLVGSVWVPFAGSFNSFLFGRVLTALGGGAMVPIGMAIIADVYPAEQRAKSLGLLGAIDTAGWVWGPLYGALLIRFLTWQWQFYLNIPLALIGLAAGWIVLADLPEVENREKIDWVGTGLLTLCLLTLNIALLGSGDVSAAGSFTSLNTEPVWSPMPFYITAAVSFILFVLSQKYLKQEAPPLIDLGLFLKRNFTPAILINFFVGAILIITMVNVPLIVNVLEIDVGQAALFSGYLLSGMTAAMALTAWLGGLGTERFSYRPVTALGLVLAFIGLGLMGFTWDANTSFWLMAWQLVILGAGFGLIIAPIGTAVINAAPENQRGIASSLVIVMRLIGMSVGLSALTSWGLYRFNTLRRLIELPDITDANYTATLIQRLTETTIGVLTETFVISAGVALLALLFALWLKRDAPTL